MHITRLTASTFCICSVPLHAVASYGRSRGGREVPDGWSGLPASPKLQGLVAVLRDDGSPVAACRNGINNNYFLEGVS